MVENLTAEYVRSILMYDPATGIFTWKRRDDVPVEWNKRWAGKKSGTIDKKGRIQICIHHRYYFAHRLAWLMMMGDWPLQEIDHYDLCQGNNAWSNLREATSTKNKGNTRRRTDNTSGFKGVSWHKPSKKWRARIQYNGSQILIGLFDDKTSSHKAYTDAATRYYGEFARSA